MKGLNRQCISLVLICVILASFLSGCGNAPAPAAGNPSTREFTDDCGRTVTIPETVTGIAVSGPLAQTYVYPLCPELFVGISTAFAKDAEKYIPKDFLALPEIGQLYGGKAAMDLEALLAAAPDVVIDVGDARDGMSEDLDALSEQTGIPFVHIDASILTAPDAYRKLGELTGKQEQAERLASWCEAVSENIIDMMSRVDADNARKSILYCLGDAGTNVMAQGSFHAETINMLGNNLAVLSDVVPHGDGNEVDLEQIMLWNPEVIVFEKGSTLKLVEEDPAWKQLSAISNGEYYAAPYGPYGWLSSPPAVQRYLGMLWLGAILYPDYCTYDLQSKITEYYDIFYRFDLNDTEYQRLTENAIR